MVCTNSFFLLKILKTASKQVSIKNCSKQLENDQKKFFKLFKKFMEYS